jgi:nitrogen fixation protein NifB
VGGDRGGCTAPANDATAEQARIDNHPCYSDSGHRYFARMHAAVAPACNIQCHYCNRKYDCSNESRPGVVSQVLTPEQAVRKALAVGAALPQLAVLGIAGPGDALANPERTFATFAALAEQAPDLKLCVSTNGLALPDYVDELARYNIEHVTITINCIDAAVGEQIYPWIFWKSRRVRGREAAQILIERQLAGLSLLAARGVLVKVNSVLIPGVNDRHLPEVAHAVRARGAFLHNIMPLISDPAHGTFFGLTGQRAPSADELAAVQQACGSELKIMRHCQQCRADAVGLLGDDRSAEFSMEKVMAAGVDAAAALERRVAYRAHVADLVAACGKVGQGGAQPAAAPVVTQVVTLHRPSAHHAERPIGRSLRIAVATRNGALIDEHFGYARAFAVYRVDGETIEHVETRSVDKYCHGSETCGEDEADETDGIAVPRLARSIAALSGCDAVLCARIGYEPWQALRRAGIQPNTEFALDAVEAALRAYWSASRATPRVPVPASGAKRA